MIVSWMDPWVSCGVSLTLWWLQLTAVEQPQLSPLEKNVCHLWRHFDNTENCEQDELWVPFCLAAGVTGVGCITLGNAQPSGPPPNEQWGEKGSMPWKSRKSQ